MLTFQLFAGFLLVVSAALVFGPQLIIYGPRILPSMLKQDQVRFVGGCLATASAFVVAAPHFGTVVFSSGEHITLVARDVVTMRFSV